MKKFIKKKSIILLSDNKELITTFKKNTNIDLIIINQEIHNLEKIKKYKIYPLNILDINNNENIILSNILNKNINTIESIIIDTTPPKYAKLFENTSLNDFTNIFNKNLYSLLKIIKLFQFNHIEKKINIIILIHREKNKNKLFFFTNVCMNKLLTEIMINISNSQDKIKINCISTENLNMEYKNVIFPYKKKCKLKKTIKIIKACNLIIKKKLEKKIIII